MCLGFVTVCKFFQYVEDMKLILFKMEIVSEDLREALKGKFTDTSRSPLSTGDIRDGFNDYHYSPKSKKDSFIDIFSPVNKNKIFICR